MSLPPSEIPQGAIRFNTDSQRLEFYAQGEWWVMSTDTPNLGRGVDSTPGARGINGGGTAASPVNRTNVIDYINIASLGDAINFGDLTENRDNWGGNGASSSTRGLFIGGNPGSNFSNTIDFVTISSTGNTQDFGDTVTALRRHGAASNATRGLYFGGQTPTDQDLIGYVTIASTGDAQDFGNLTSTRHGHMAGCGSPIRTLAAGGDTVNNIDMITISTLGDAQDFGDLLEARWGVTGCSNATRGIFAGGFGPDRSDTIQYVTIATAGNATNFGNLLAANYIQGGSSSPTRSVFAGGNPTPTQTNVIEYVEIMTEGNSVDFGDLTVARYNPSSFSNAHGGL